MELRVTHLLVGEAMHAKLHAMLAFLTDLVKEIKGERNVILKIRDC
jgi:hypothetical protein